MTDKKNDCFSARNPVTGEFLNTYYPETTENELNNAAEAAYGAFRSYRQTSPEQRAAFLEQISEDIMQQGENLIEMCMAETGLPHTRLTGERARTTGQLKMFAELIREGSWVDARIDTAIPDRKPVSKPDLRQIHIPVGVVAVFGAGNFPLAFSVAGGDTASALAAGCPVIVKAHPAHPGTSEMVGQAVLNAVKKTGMPDGVFSLIHGRENSTGLSLVTHPVVQAVGFTGSFRGGKALFDAAAKRPQPIPVYAEMGSTNPVFVLKGYPENRMVDIVSGLVASVTLGTGQFCTKPGLILLEESEHTELFLDIFTEKIRSSSVGTMLTTEIKERYLEGIASASSKQGITLPAKGTADSSFCGAPACVLQTTAACFFQYPELEEEIFGPCTLIVTCNRNEMLAIAEGLSGHLTASILCCENNHPELLNLSGILENKAGRVIFNGFPTGVEVCHSMHHGGPFPATTDVRSTSVGTAAVRRFTRPVCYQDCPQELLPEALRDDNPPGILRMVNGAYTRETLLNI
ncbi:MAG: aldehyde dehydrogenase (NADP(+)) [Bacteroidetes bacterium]|nr:aldehyde dehydrogenase (NADP(+)) [Bacteroidota bacterium]